MPNPRKPRRMKVLQGTDQPCRAKPEAELPEARDLSPPEWLNGTDAADMWERLTGILGPVRVLSAGDLDALGHLANLHGRCVRLWRAGEAPTAAELTQLRLMLGEFGLTPASRSKAGQIGESKDVNPFEKLKMRGA